MEYETKSIVRPYVRLQLKVNDDRISNYSLNQDKIDCTPDEINIYINNNVCSKHTKQIVDQILFNITTCFLDKAVLFPDYIDQVLDYAYKNTDSLQIQHNILYALINIVPRLIYIKDPSTNIFNEKSKRKYPGFQNYHDLFSALLGKTFLENGIVTFDSEIIDN